MIKSTSSSWLSRKQLAFLALKPISILLSNPKWLSVIIDTWTPIYLTNPKLMFIYLKDSQFRIPRNLPGKFKRLVCEAEKKSRPISSMPSSKITFVTLFIGLFQQCFVLNTHFRFQPLFWLDDDVSWTPFSFSL